MADDLKLKISIEGDIDEKSIQKSADDAGKKIKDTIEKTKISLRLEKDELNKNIKQIEKTLKDEKIVIDKSLFFRAQLELQEFKTRVREIDDELEQLNQKASQSLNIEAFGHLLNSGILDKIGSGVVSLGKKLLSLGDEAQQAQISFTTMLGSASDAEKLIAELSDFASKTPFELSGIRDSAKQLLAMGVQAKDMIPTLKALGDVSAGLNVPLERLAVNYGQVLTQGKLTGKELKDFTTAGVPLVDELAKNLNKSKTEIQDMVSAGEISSQDMVDAFDSMTSAGGRFADLMEAQSNTLSGLLSNLNDEISLTGETIGSQLVPTASSFVGILGNIAQKIREWVQENPKLTTALITFVGVVGGLLALGGSLAGVLTLVTAAFGGMVLPILEVVAALGVLTAIGVTVYNNLQEIAKKNEFAGETFESLSKKIKENEQALADLDKQLQDGQISLEEYTEKKAELEEQEKRLKSALDDTYMSLDDVKSAIDDVSNANISNEQKLKRLEEIRQKAFSTMQSVEQLKASLASIDGSYQGIINNKNGKLSWSGLGSYIKKNWKDTWSLFGLSSETGDQWEQRIIDEHNYLQERIDNYDEFAKQKEELDKAIAETEVKTEKDKQEEIKKITGGSGGSTKQAKKELDEKKKLLKEERDMRISEVENTIMDEESKLAAILEINDDYKDKLYELEKGETENVIKEAEKQLKAREDAIKKGIDYYNDLKKITDKVDDAVEKHTENVAKIGDEWDNVKKKAKDSLREVNNSLTELDKNFASDMGERYVEVEDSIKEFQRKYGKSEWLEGYSIDMLRNRDSDEISGIKVKDAIEYLNLLKEQKFLEENLTQEIKDQVDEIRNVTEAEQLRYKYEQERAALVEKSKILSAISDSGNFDEEAKVRYKDLTKETVEYFDEEEQSWKDITDFKNSEYARDVLDNQEKLNQKKEDLDKAFENELKAYGDQVINIKKEYETDTKNYKDELNNKKQAFADYVRDMNALASQLSSKVAHNAYGGNILAGGVSMVGENGPEAIVARQSSYVQPRNAVQNNSTIYNNQNSLSVNGIEIGNFNSVEDLLNGLKPYLTRRS